MKIAFVAFVVFALAACSPTPPSGTNPASATSQAASAADASSASTPLPASTATAPAADTTSVLTQYHWQLTAATDKSGQRIEALFARADKPLQLDFDSRGLSVGNTCNRMHGGYSVASGKLEISRFASTMMACPDPKLMALDTAAGKYLNGTLAFSLDSAAEKPELALTTAQGDKLAFAGIPTAATRYGSAGETMFFEVASQTKPCNHPLMPNAQCLYVRELHYGANGVREGQPEPWQILGQNIEGYTHQQGVRNVLRVKRYKIANPPADASSVAYVLDMVVESESTPR